VQITVP
jgi:hypothetical protein